MRDNSLLIAIDYDNTYAAARGLFAGFVRQCKTLGIDVICVTGRHPTHPIEDSTLTVPVIYAAGELKRNAAERAGYVVDIWIDDEPGTIERCRVLDWSEE